MPSARHLRRRVDVRASTSTKLTTQHARPRAIPKSKSKPKHNDSDPQLHSPVRRLDKRIEQLQHSKRVRENEDDEGEEEVEEEVEAGKEVEVIVVGRKRRRAGIAVTAEKQEEKEEEEEEELSHEEGHKDKKRLQKPATQMPPLAARSTSLGYFLGAHISSAGGVQHSILNSVHIGGNSFALFLRSQRRWNSPDLTPASISEFKAGLLTNSYNAKKHILPHGSYLVNLAHGDDEKWQQSYDYFLEDLKRCEKLGIGLYNFHPGHTGLNPRSKSLLKIAMSLNRAHKETSGVVTLLENMAGHGTPESILGSTLEDLCEVIEHVEDKTRVGVCIDTCHAFVAGYDLRTESAFETFWSDFDRIVGKKYLRAMHLNDSKAPLGSRRDLHQHIGQGYLGLEAFRLIMNCERLKDMPLVLETPMVDEGKSWAEEIKLLESLVGAKGVEEWFLKKSKVLQKLGKAEMERVEAIVERRKQKEALKSQKKAEKAEKDKIATKKAHGGGIAQWLSKGKKKVTRKRAASKEVEEVEKDSAGEEGEDGELSEENDR